MNEETKQRSQTKTEQKTEQPLNEMPWWPPSQDYSRFFSDPNKVNFNKPATSQNFFFSQVHIWLVKLRREYPFSMNLVLLLTHFSFNDYSTVLFFGVIFRAAWKQFYFEAALSIFKFWPFSASSLPSLLFVLFLLGEFHVVTSRYRPSHLSTIPKLHLSPQ